MVGLGSQRRPGDWSYEHGVCGMFMCMGLRRGTASSRDISRGIRNDLLAQRETVITIAKGRRQTRGLEAHAVTPVGVWAQELRPGLCVCTHPPPQSSASSGCQGWACVASLPVGFLVLLGLVPHVSSLLIQALPCSLGTHG
jgi:hypothetical protein